MQDRVFRLSVIQNIHERLRESNLLYVPLITYCGDQALGFEDATALVHDGLYVLRHAARVKNLGGHIVLGGDNLPPLVEIGLTDLPKSGGARAPRPPRLRRACYLNDLKEKMRTRKKPPFSISR